jgi:hypothetical protein
MADFLDVKLNLPNLRPLDERMRSRLRGDVISLIRRVKARVVENLSGRLLQRRSGRLVGAVRSELIETTDSIGGRVFIDGVPYARIQDAGGKTSPHVIVARNSKSLAFVWHGRQVFFRRVNHPGSNIRGVHYMEDALDAMRQDIIDTYRGAVKVVR